MRRTRLFNRGLDKSDLVTLVNQYNQTYAGKKGPNPGQTFPTVTLPANYDFGRNFNSQDLRLTKLFKWRERYELQILAEGFNIFNFANKGGYSSNLLNPGFGIPTSRAGGTFGNAPRNNMYGPGQYQWDIALFKNVAVKARQSFQFRMEVFNFLNHPNLNNPSTDPTSASFGRITSKDGSRRDIQLSLRYLF